MPGERQHQLQPPHAFGHHHVLPQEQRLLVEPARQLTCDGHLLQQAIMSPLSWRPSLLDIYNTVQEGLTCLLYKES